MIALGQVGHGAYRGEMQVALFATLGLCGYGIWVLVGSFLRGPTNPDPWDESIAAQLEAEDATPLCHRCLTPHDSIADFCPDCGAAVGPYTNLLPFPYLFSIGHTLRIGTGGGFKKTPLTILGFLLFSLAEYAVFAPVYWVQFLLHLSGRGTPPPAAQPPVSKPG